MNFLHFLRLPLSQHNTPIDRRYPSDDPTDTVHCVYRDLMGRDTIWRHNGMDADALAVDNPDDPRTWHHVHRNPELSYLGREGHTPIHRGVLKALSLDTVTSIGLDALVAEWPHLSDDGERLAYTRDAKAGRADRQTVTSVGKYLTRVFPTLRSDEIRDIVALVTNNNFICRFVDDDVAAFVDVAQHGPNSCMKWSNYNPAYRTHPYECYAPKYGWRMAVRIREADKDNGIGNTPYYGRALVYVGDANDAEHSKGIFVRSFGVAGGQDPDGSSYSQADQALEAWLKEQGYAHLCEYPDGAKLDRLVNRDGDIVAPYIDGSSRRVSLHTRYLEIDRDGSVECDNTDGTLGQDEDMYECDRCGDNVDEDDTYYIESENQRVCQCCLDNYYVYARVSGNHHEYVNEHDAVCVDGEYYTPDAMLENDIIEVTMGWDSGEFKHVDDAICDVDCEWWSTTSYTKGEVVQLHDDSGHSGEYMDADYALKDINGNYWHTDDEDIRVTRVEAGTHAGEFAICEDTVTCINGVVWHTDSIGEFILEDDMGDYYEAPLSQAPAQRTVPETDEDSVEVSGELTTSGE